MPELPEVETIRRGLVPRMEGRRIARVAQRRPDLRFPLPDRFVQRLEGRRVTGVGRYGKVLLLGLEGPSTLMVHFGMSGRIVLAPPEDISTSPLHPHDHVSLWMEDGWEIRYRDPRRFGYMDLVAGDPLDPDRSDGPSSVPHLRNLGPDPLGPGFDTAVLAARLKGRSGPIKPVLLNQQVLAGLGNIYACEALYRARIAPDRPAGNLTGDEMAALCHAIRSVLLEAVAAGGSSLRDYVQTSGDLGMFQKAWAVYGRAGSPCPACDPVAQCPGIQCRRQGGRSTFYCARLQR